MKRPNPLLFALCLGLSACSLASEEAPAALSYAESTTEEASAAEYAAEYAAEAEPGDTSSPEAGPSRSIIRTYRIELRADEPSEVLALARELVSARGGFVDESSAGGPGRSTTAATASFRVPSSALDGMVVNMRELGEVLGESEEGEDVTDQLVDLDARLGAKRHLEERLVALATRSGSVDDLLRVEQELARVRGEIEVMAARQRGIEEKVAFSTIHLRVEAPVQPMAYVAQSFGSRLSNSLSRGLRAAGDVVVGIVGFGAATSPLLALLLMIGLPIRHLRRRRREALSHVPA